MFAAIQNDSAREKKLPLLMCGRPMGLGVLSATEIQRQSNVGQ